MPQFDLKKTTVKFKDAGSNNISIKVREGVLRWSHKKTREYIRDRGLLSEVRNGNQEPVEVSFDLVWEFITANSGGTETPEDALKKRGEASDWATVGAACDPYCIKIEIVYTPNCGGAQIETIVIDKFYYEQIDHNVADGTLSFSGRANIVAVTATRS